MTAIRAWLRIDLRRRWPSLIVLGLLVAVSSGTVLAAVAGARRGDSALQRLAARTLPASAMVLPNQRGFDWRRVRAMPEVETLTTFMLGSSFQLQGIPSGGVGFPPGDDEGLRTIERPVVLAGRLPDPNRADEVLVTPLFVQHYHHGLGDTVTALFYSEQQVRFLTGLGPLSPSDAPAGPHLALRIVGVGFSTFYQDTQGSAGGLLPSPELAKRYRANIYNDTVHYTNALVRLRGGEAALPAFQEHLATLTGRQDIAVENRADTLRRQQRSFTFQARCLLAFGAAALIAALFLVGQAVARYTASSIVELQVMRAVGMTPGQAAGAAAAGPSLAALVGATLGVAAAALASWWFPIGSADLVEPQPGFDIDIAVLGLGWVTTPLLVLAGSVMAARPSRGAQGEATDRSVVAAGAARVGLPVPVVVGTRFALEAGRGRTSVPVRPALFGAIGGVLGVLGAFTFSTGVADATANPARFGQTWQLVMFAGYNDRDSGSVEAVLKAVARDVDVTAVNDARIAVAHAGVQDTAVTLFGYRPVGHAVEVVLTSGRMPASDSEVVLAPNAADAVGARVGSRVNFQGAVAARALTVVGIGFAPWSPHSDYSTGGWLTEAAYTELFGAKFKFRLAQIAIRPAADRDAVLTRLGRITGATPGTFLAPVTPDRVRELKTVRLLPLALGVFLMLLAVGAVGHALATAVRRRRHDVAVLRALGMTPWQSRGVVLTQASVLAAAGLTFGVPLGVALGRTTWRAVTDQTPLQFVAPLAFWALLLVGPLALLIANALAAWPGQQAARLRIGHVLRAE